MAGAELAEEAALGDSRRRSSINSRIMATNSGSVPTVGTRISSCPARASSVLGLDVEIEEHFEMVGDEPDRDDDHVLDAGVMEPIQLVENIGLEPGDVRRSAAALPGQPVARCAGESLTSRLTSRNCRS